MPRTNILTGSRTFQSLRAFDLDTCTKRQIKDYFINSYDLNESLFLGLKDDSVFYKCPDRLRLPLIFYYAHTACVYVNKLMLGGLIQERVNVDFETMFELGVDEMSWDDTEHSRMGDAFQWPSVSEIVEYRRKVRNVILKVIEDTPLTLPVTMDSPWWALMMGMEHERIHFETSAVLIRQLPVDLVQRPEGWTYGPSKAGRPIGENSMVSVCAREVAMGKPTDFPSYGWDNEYGEMTSKVPPFEASKYLVTNGEFLKFVEDGGYSSANLWTEEGWAWVKFKQARHPLFWCCDQGCKSGCGGDIARASHCNVSLGKSKFEYRVLFDVVDMPWEWPVEVNYHEAKAFCKWKGPGYRLPVEAEHHVMRGKQLPASRGVESDIIFQKDMQSNMYLQYGSNTPVNEYPPTECGFYDVFGNVWEWGEDHFNGLTGFRSHFMYDDFSSPFYDGKHCMTMGASWISTGHMASRFARYAFRRHFFQFCGFRLARSISDNGTKVDIPARFVDTDVFMLGSGVQAKEIYLDDSFNVERQPSANPVYLYDTPETLQRVLTEEYCNHDNMAVVVARLCGRYTGLYNVPPHSAVHVGCATGRGSFELSRFFNKVLALEICGRQIDAALHLQSDRRFTTDDGVTVTLQGDYDLAKITFKQLTWIPNEVGSHELVLLSHLDRCQTPKAWLARLWEVTKANGILVIASRDGKWTKDALHPYLSDRMMCVKSEDASYVEGDSKEKAAITVWKRK